MLVTIDVSKVARVEIAISDSEHLDGEVKSSQNERVQEGHHLEEMQFASATEYR